MASRRKQRQAAVREGLRLRRLWRRPPRAIITAVDRDAGTITVMRVPYEAEPIEWVRV